MIKNSNSNSNIKEVKKESTSNKLIRTTQDRLPSNLMQTNVLSTHTKLPHFIHEENKNTETQRQEDKLSRNRSRIENRIQEGHIDSNNHKNDRQQLRHEEHLIAALLLPRRLLEERLQVSSCTE